MEQDNLPVVSGNQLSRRQYTDNSIECVWVWMYNKCVQRSQFYLKLADWELSVKLNRLGADSEKIYYKIITIIRMLF